MIAENIGYHLSENGYDVKLADILQVQEGAWVKFGTWLHRLLNKRAPVLWRFLYRYGHVIFSPLRTVVASTNYGETKKIIDAFQPDIVITTQTTASAVVSYLKGQGLYTGSFAIAFSDYHFHPYWLYPHCDLYLANIPEQKTEMERLGVPSSSVAVCGMTLKPKIRVTVSEVRKKFGIPEDSKVVLFSSGSLGTSFDLSWLMNTAAALASNNNIHVLIVCGKNEPMHQALLQSNTLPNIHILGFYEPMGELYAIADLMVGKAGGLSLAETWQYGLPVIVTHYLPGQEEYNYEYVKQRSLVIEGIEKRLPIPSEKLISKIIEELQSRAVKKSLLDNEHLLDLIQDNPRKSRIFSAVERLLYKVK
jgi:processive 1,2-diacylglycerol beta-glucosyltransferase